MRQANFKRIRRRVQESLFMAKPAFLPHLMDIYRHVNDIHAVNFSWSKDSHMYTLQVRRAGIWQSYFCIG